MYKLPKAPLVTQISLRESFSYGSPRQRFSCLVLQHADRIITILVHRCLGRLGMHFLYQRQKGRFLRISKRQVSIECVFSSWYCFCRANMRFLAFLSLKNVDDLSSSWCLGIVVFKCRAKKRTATVSVLLRGEAVTVDQDDNRREQRGTPKRLKIG